MSIPPRVHCLLHVMTRTVSYLDVFASWFFVVPVALEMNSKLFIEAHRVNRAFG